MKRRMLILPIVMLFVLTFFGCGKNEPTQPAVPTIVGKWVTEVDMTDAINHMVQAQSGTSTVAVDFPVRLELVFRDDSVYSLGFDRAYLDAQIDILGDVLWQIVTEQAAAKENMSVTDVSRALQEQGKSKDIMMEQLDLASFFENSICHTGFWKQENDLLYFAEAADSFAEEAALGYQLDGEELVLTYTEAPAEEGAEAAQTTVTFTMAK